MNNMPNISDSDLQKIAERKSFKGEEVFNTLEVAIDNAKERSRTTPRIVYLDSGLGGAGYIVYTHGVSMKGRSLLYKFKAGEQIPI